MRKRRGREGRMKKVREEKGKCAAKETRRNAEKSGMEESEKSPDYVQSHSTFVLAYRLVYA